MTHEERARAVYHDWRERCLKNGSYMFISNIDLMEQAIVAALKEVETETARRCEEIAEGCEEDNYGEISKSIADKIRAAFPEVKNG